MPAENSQNQVELTPDEKRAKREKEVLYLRFKLQKGLLSRVYEPNEEEMEQVSELISKLERYPDLECSIIRATKINKVLKYILKLSEIPKDSEFQIRNRSKALLETYKRILEGVEQHDTLVPVQESFGRLNLIPSGVVNDWVVVIQAEEDNVIMEERFFNPL